MKRRPSWEMWAPVVYWGATYTLRALLTLLVRWRASGREFVPRSGAVIFVSNHLNNADPPILGAGIARRRLRFMAKVELFKLPFGVIPRMYGAFPVRRFESDAGALLTAERLLKDGQAIGMFPEGTRSRTGRLGRAHPGTAVIALRTGAPVVPCAITGTQILANPLRLILRPRFSVSIGEPLRFEARRRPATNEIEAASERILDSIQRLLPPEYLPTYTDQYGTDGSAGQAGR
ncbi:MAG: lysophospholipid acyltransferase family protein [Dehalococcoidia bacterium]